MSGEVLLKSKDSFPATVLISKEDLEAQVSRDANYAFGKLVGEQKFVFEPSTKRVTLSSTLIAQSNVPNTVATAIGVEVASDSPLPKFKAELKFPTLQGTISGFEFVAVDVSIAIEITPRPPRTPQRSLNAEPQPATTTVSPWVFALGAGVVLTATALFVANLVEDGFTAGAGIADDPLVFSATGAAFARGLAMMGIAATAGLPKAITPARVQLSTSITSKGQSL
jgi:hypothetical protein